MQEQLDISDMSIEQLEALAYRLVEQKSNIDMNLSTVQQQIAVKRRELNTETQEPDEADTEE